MRRTFSSVVLAMLAIAVLLPTFVQAQTERSDKTVFIRPHVGISYYLGDNEKSPFNFDGDLFDNSFPYNLGVEVGYQFNPRYSLGLGVAFGDYSGISEFVSDLDVSDHPSTRTNVQLIARYLISEKKIAPYLAAGLHATFGETAVYGPAPCTTVGVCGTSNETSFGPLFGAGLDFFIGENTSFFLEHMVNLTFPDDKVDGFDGNGFGSFDVLGATSVGLKFNLNRFTPVTVDDMICPAEEFETGESVAFSASVNVDATQPVVSTWDFGDGASASGLTASHTYATAGNYDVVFKATNGQGKGSDSRTCAVTVVPACEAAAIVSMRASDMNPDTETSIRFSADVNGTTPVSYTWDFGDGTTSSDATPSHTFKEAGTYTITLEVTNCGGTVSRTMTITVTPYEAAICREVTEMNTAFFGRNSSTLTEEARGELNDNLEILLECPNLNVRVEGLAAPGERRAQQLSEDRARAVEQFYVDNGVAASRIVSSGSGRAQGTSKKEGLSGFRRADTIPVR